MRQVGAASGFAELPIVVRLLLGLMLFELCGYAYHRLAHRVPALWRLHAVHHSAPTLDWLASFRQHPLEIGLVTLAPRPNYLESYPTKLFEYMASGVPVVASDFPLWRKIVEDAGCGLLVDPQKPEAIAKAMDWLFEHPNQAADMGAAGRRAAHRTYNWQSEADKLLALYEKMEG